MGNVFVGKCGDSWKIIVEDTTLVVSPDTALELLKELDEKLNVEAVSRRLDEAMDNSAELILE